MDKRIEHECGDVATTGGVTETLAKHEQAKRTRDGRGNTRTESMVRDTDEVVTIDDFDADPSRS